MVNGKEVKLPSGALLNIGVSTFEVAKAMYQVVLEEVRTTSLDPDKEIDANFFKDMACIGFSSKKIEACVWKCFEKCLYDGKRIDKDTFEPVEARQDYLLACYEVVQENVLPFMKPLYAKYQDILTLLKGSVQA